MTALHALLIALVLLRAVASAPPEWRRDGLGRVLWAHRAPRAVLVATQRGVLASLSLSTGALLWRREIHPSLVAVACPTTATLAALLPDRSVITVSVHTGAVLWHTAPCTAPRVAHPVLRVCAPVAPYTVLRAAHISREWRLGNAVLHSAPDGCLALSRAARQLWRREEGLAHATAAALFVRPASSVLVVLGLRALHALSASDGALLWKFPILAVHCTLVTGHASVAVAVCDDGEGGALIKGVEAASGRLVLHTTVQHLLPTQAAVEKCGSQGAGVRVRLVDEAGRERVVATAKCTELVEEVSWLSYQIGGRAVCSVRGGAQTWRVALPPGATLAAVAKARRPHSAASPVRAPAVRVTRDRQLLWRYVDPNIALVLATDSTRLLLHALLLDLHTGAVLNAVTHAQAAGLVTAVRGESWFAYSFWSTLMLQQELHVIDLYEESSKASAVGHALRAVAGAAAGPLRLLEALGLEPRHRDAQQQEQHQQQQCLKEDDVQCTAGETDRLQTLLKKPVTVRSSSLTTGRIIGLDVTQTQLGLMEPAVVMMLETGQVALVSKLMLDARRPKDHSAVDGTEFVVPYSPLLSLSSRSREALYVSAGAWVTSLSHVAVAPVYGRESQCQIAAIGIDIMYSVVEPVGTFDSIPADFVYSAVNGMILFLGASLVYTQRLKTKASLSRSW